MTASPDVRVLPIPSGTLCTYRGAVVRACFRPFEAAYDVIPFGERRPVARVTRGELEVCRG